ncbi:MAG: NDP-sugar synthase [Candidatus Omnitrophica bacterium]|nr:NDP-sugar synthase [Candidatus Omnitrophota bacterium]MCM8824715.1 NDP-sugar synthase [Candidatus Omnitrophota bacterium]
MILLGGQGTRLRPFTLSRPKSFLPVANVPMIHYQLMLLAKYKVDNVILAISPHCKKYRDFLNIAKNLGIKLSLSCEKYPLGTGGGIKNAFRYLKGDEPFFVFNGDIISDCNLEKMLAFHKSSRSDVSIAVVKVENPKDFGVLVIDEEKRIRQFIEKPEVPVSNLINAGIYIFQPEILDEIPSGREVSVEKETFPYLIRSGKKVYAYIHDGYWMDVGTLDKYRIANFDIMEGKLKIGLNVTNTGKLLTGENVVFEKDVEARGAVIIGDGCHIGKNTVLKDSILFENVKIGKNCLIENSIIGRDVHIECNCEIHDSAIADRCRLRHYTKIKKF